MLPVRPLAFALATLATAGTGLAAIGAMAGCSSSNGGASPRADASPDVDAEVDAPGDSASRDSGSGQDGQVEATTPDAAPGPCVPLPTQGGGYPPLTILATGLVTPRAVAVDPASAYVMTGGGGASNNSAVVRIGLDGGAPATVATSDAGSDTLAIDSTSAYWVTSGGSAGNGFVLRAPLQGGPAEPLAATTNAYAVAVSGPTVYFTDYYPTPGALLSVGLDGGTPVPTSTPGTLIVNNAVAASADGAFWLSANNDGFGALNVGQVWMAPPGGGGQGKMLADGQTAPSQIAVDDTNVYWTNQGDGMTLPGSVVKVPVHGGAPVTLATMCAAESRPLAIAVADGQVYFTVKQSSTPWSVARVPAAGGPTTILTVATSPVGIAVQGNDLYLADVASQTLGKTPR